eukprot:11184141-Lingulodinium_polyedra.AAC.1
MSAAQHTSTPHTLAIEPKWFAPGRRYDPSARVTPSITPLQHRVCLQLDVSPVQAKSATKGGSSASGPPSAWPR